MLDPDSAELSREGQSWSAALLSLLVLLLEVKNEMSACSRSFSCAALCIPNSQAKRADSRGEDEADEADDVEEEDANCPSEQDEDDGSMIRLDIMLCRSQRGPFPVSNHVKLITALPCPNPAQTPFIR